MNRPGGPLIVELFGLPGSGKSTLCNSLKKALIAKGLDVGDLGEHLGDGSMSALRRHLMRARYALYGLLRAPIQVLKALKLVRRDGQDSAFHTAKVLWNIVVILGWYRWLRRRNDRHAVVLVDQGLVQAVWSIRFTARGVGADWPAFLSDFGLDRILLIALRIEPEFARKRLSERVASPSRMNAYADQNHAQQWMKADRIVDELTAGLRAATPATAVFEVKDDGASTPDELAQKLVSAVLSAHDDR